MRVLRTLLSFSLLLPLYLSAQSAQVQNVDPSVAAGLIQAALAGQNLQIQSQNGQTYYSSPVQMTVKTMLGSLTYLTKYVFDYDGNTISISLDKNFTNKRGMPLHNGPNQAEQEQYLNLLAAKMTGIVEGMNGGSHAPMPANSAAEQSSGTQGTDQPANLATDSTPIPQQGTQEYLWYLLDHVSWIPDGDVPQKQVYVFAGPHCPISRQFYQQSRSLGHKVQMRWIVDMDETQATLLTPTHDALDRQYGPEFTTEVNKSPVVGPDIKDAFNAAKVYSFDRKLALINLLKTVDEGKCNFPQYPTVIWQERDGLHCSSDLAILDHAGSVIARPEAAVLPPPFQFNFKFQYAQYAQYAKIKTPLQAQYDKVPVYGLPYESSVVFGTLPKGTSPDDGIIGMVTLNGVQWIHFFNRKNVLGYVRLSDVQPGGSAAPQFRSANTSAGSSIPSGYSQVSRSSASNFVQDSAPMPHIPDTSKAKRYVMGLLPDKCYCSDGLCPVMLSNDKYAFIDRSGRQAFPEAVDQNPQMGCPQFHDGYAVVIPPNTGYGMLIDKNGNQAFPGVTGNISRFRDGVAVVHATNGQYSTGYYLLDLHGKRYPISEDAGAAMSLNNDAIYQGPIPGEYTADHIYYVDNKGKILLKIVGMDASSFREGLSWIRMCDGSSEGDCKYGAIDEKGSTAIPFMYTYKPHDFSDGLAAVQDRSGKYGYIDKNNHIVIPPQFENEIIPFKNGHAVVRALSIEPIVIDKSGVTVKKLPSTFTCNTIFGAGPRRIDGLCVYGSSGGGVGLTDSNGNVIIPMGYFIYIGEFGDGLDGLAWAGANIGGHKVEGFINIHGDFVVIKGESQF